MRLAWAAAVAAVLLTGCSIVSSDDETIWVDLAVAAMRLPPGVILDGVM